MSKPALGNAAERLKRAMPSFDKVPPLPKEGAPAVTVVPRPTTNAKRPYRLGTYLTTEAGARLNRLVQHFKATKGQRCGAPDVIETALIQLERELKL